MSSVSGISLKQVASSLGENGRKINQIIKITNEAFDHFLKSQSLAAYDGFVDGIPAKFHISKGRDMNELMELRFNTLQEFTDNNILFVHALSKVEMPPKDGKKSEGHAIVFASQDYVSTLGNFLVVGDSLFEEHATVCDDKGSEMSKSLGKIVLDIGKTLNVICAKHPIIHPELQDIFLREGYNGEYVALFGKINVVRNAKEKISSSKHWAYIIEKIFESARMEQSDTIRDFIDLLSTNKKYLTGRQYFRHPLFLSSEDKIALIYDIAAQTIAFDRDEFLKYGFSWPDVPFLDKMPRHRHYKKNFLDFILFVRDKLEHFDELDQSEVGSTKDEFLEAIASNVRYFWSAVGRVVALSK